MTTDDAKYDTEVRNRTIRVKLSHGNSYIDTLSGYKREHNGRVYYQTQAHGWIERSNFRYDKPMPTSKLDAASMSALHQARRAIA